MYTNGVGGSHDEDPLEINSDVHTDLDDPPCLLLGARLPEAQHTQSRYLR